MTADCLAPSCSAVPADSPNHSDRSSAYQSRKKFRANGLLQNRNHYSSANRLRRQRRKASSARSDRSRKGLSRRSRAAKAGWSPERRARQAALIRSWAPWRRSTGPKTVAGKARCAMNALKHGFRSQAKIREYQRIRYVLRLAAQNIALLRLHIRARDAGLRIKIQIPAVGAATFRSSNTQTSTSPLRGGRNRRSATARRFGWGDSGTNQDTASPNPGRFGPHALGLE